MAPPPKYLSEAFESVKSKYKAFGKNHPIKDESNNSAT